MDAAVQMAPTHRFYKDGNKIDEYVGSSYPALEVRPNADPILLSFPRRPLLTGAFSFCLQRMMGAVVAGR
jgi:hypothetical protein